ncbi:cysteine--tRNA ligase [Candidatus Woesearchaeota archaeon]|nr:cysteine--tRNA ligase [Candidatus Woesearchaeota archaeon]
MIKLYNTSTRKVEVFKPIKPGFVEIYTCGPTVYNYAHIGNLRTYIFEDFLKRAFFYNCFKVKHVMNITDVGHLTSDADSGEDKMLKGAKREGKTVWEIAEFYAKAFKQDIERLNIFEPDIWCKATDHIKEMVQLIQRLEKNGHIYISDGNVYYDVSTFKNYGKLARLKLKKLKAGARIAVDEKKRNPQDFALWFTKSKFEEQEMKWDSPFGRGYPGWHVECSAMSIKYLGEHFDMHCGGIDHIPVHHTNEIAQSEGATGKKWVNYWLHGEFLLIDKGKMAKSGENFVTLQTLIDKGYDPLDYRYLCLTTHYRKQLHFSFEALDGAKNSYTNLKERVRDLKTNLEGDNGDAGGYEKGFLEAINDDLNMPEALALTWNLIKDQKVGNKLKYETLLKFDKVLGLKISELQTEIKVSEDIKKLIREREEARKNKDWKKSDQIRDEIKRKGFIIEDSAEGIKLKKL